MNNNLKNFIDAEGKVTMLPRKQFPRKGVLKYLADKFEYDRIYTEKQVNEICDKWHTFHDYFLIRRELIESKLLSREIDGSKYWRTKNDDTNED